MALITCKSCNTIIDNSTGEVHSENSNSIVDLQNKNDLLSKKIDELEKRLPKETDPEPEPEPEPEPVENPNDPY